jgi:acetyl-CoA C-acetyltransferase
VSRPLPVVITALAASPAAGSSTSQPWQDMTWGGNWDAEKVGERWDGGSAEQDGTVYGWPTETYGYNASTCPDMDVSKTDTTGDPLTVAEDEGVRAGTTVESLSGLRPAFDREGTITAGNASQISDGAAALVLTTRDRADQLGVPVLATIEAYGAVAGPDPSLLLQPANAIRAAAAKVDADPAGFDRYEMNEAFASVALASGRDLGVDEERINVNGGAVALGHPIGCSGARIVVTLIHELTRIGGGRGVAALCGGGGQGDALVVRVG